MKKYAYKLNKIAHRQYGAVLVEFALVVTLLLMFIFGIIQWGILINAVNSTSQISREGARYAAVHATEANSDTAIKSYIKKVAGGTTLAYADLTVTITPSPTDKDSSGNFLRTAGNPVTVSITYPLSKKYIFPSGFIPGTTAGKKTTKQSTMVIEPQ